LAYSTGTTAVLIDNQSSSNKNTHNKMDQHIDQEKKNITSTGYPHQSWIYYVHKIHFQSSA